MIQLEMDEHTKNIYCDAGSTPWRLESSLREFANITPVDFWFRYPVHVVDANRVLKALPAVGTSEAGRLVNGKSKSTDRCSEEIRTAFDIENMDGKGVPLKELAAYLDISERAVRERLKKLEGEFKVVQGNVVRLSLD